MISTFGKSDVMAGCVGGLVAWIGMTYIAGPWFNNLRKKKPKLHVTVHEEHYEEKHEGYTEHNDIRIRNLQRLVRTLEETVKDLEERNESLRQSNRHLTKLANCTANVSFNHQRNICKNKNNKGSPQTRDGVGEHDRDLIFIDYPSCEFALLRASSNEI